MSRPETKLIGIHFDLCRITGISNEEYGHFGKNPDPAKKAIPLIDTPDASDAAPAIAFLQISPSRAFGPHDATPVGTYALRVRSGKTDVRQCRFEYESVSNWWELFVLQTFYKIPRSVISKSYGKVNGKESIVFPARDWPDYDLQPLKHPMVQITGNGGGRFWNLFKHGYDPVANNWRFLSIEGTGNPLSFYHLHAQHIRADAQIEIHNSSHIDVFGMKQELLSCMMRVSDSSHFRLFGVAGIGSPFQKGGSHFVFENCTDFLLAIPGDQPNLGNTSRLMPHGGRSPLTWPARRNTTSSPTNPKAPTNQSSSAATSAPFSTRLASLDFFIRESF